MIKKPKQISFLEITSNTNIITASTTTIHNPQIPKSHNSNQTHNFKTLKQKSNHYPFLISSKHTARFLKTFPLFFSGYIPIINQIKSQILESQLFKTLKQKSNHYPFLFSSNLVLSPFFPSGYFSRI
ncbi:hypothetical protein Droror1_Dr00002209 [Drosera rotundifolia]